MAYDYQERQEQQTRFTPQPQARFMPRAMWALIALNGLVFVVTGAQGGFSNTSDDVLWRCGMLYAPDIWRGAWWRLLTAMFLHGGLFHVAVNMWALHNLGAALEELYGWRRFLVLYLGAGWLGSLASLIFTGASVGASGAIFGLAGVWLAIALRRRAYFQQFGQQVLMTIAINMVISFSMHGIDKYGHLGGLVGGFILGSLMPNPLPEFRATPARRAAVVAALLLFLLLTPLAVRLSLAHLADTGLGGAD